MNKNYFLLDELTDDPFKDAKIHSQR